MLTILSQSSLHPPQQRFAGVNSWMKGAEGLRKMQMELQYSVPLSSWKNVKLALPPLREPLTHQTLRDFGTAFFDSQLWSRGLLFL